MSRELPFAIEAHLTDRRGVCQYVALVDGEPVDIVRYTPGDTDKRRKAAESWRQNSALHNGQLLTTKEISNALAAVEANARSDIEAALEQQEDDETVGIETASYVDENVIVELCWNEQNDRPDFVIFDRACQSVERRDTFEVGDGLLIPPRCWRGIVGPGSATVLLPTEYDETGIDETALRADIQTFINRYVQLPEGGTELFAEYVNLTWVFDAFSECPYIASRTIDAGKGKSRALETSGSVCYRPIWCGGGSSASAMRRLLDIFRGTLLADEFDEQSDTELTSTLAKILNQGFQRNRPLVLCDGESNEPRPFYIYGPKIFSLRKRFRDDATESRTLSVWMRKRTRPDIPINMPQARFDREALALRNRLLAWRCANLGKIRIDPEHADPALEDRLNQIASPLLAVAATPEGRARIIASLKHQQDAIATSRGESFAGAVLGLLLEITEIGATVRPKDIAREMNERQARAEGITVEKLSKPVKPWRVGRVLSQDLELPRAGRDSTGVRYVLDPTRVEELTARFGLDAPQSGAPPCEPYTPTLNTEPYTEKPRLEPENGDLCRGVACVGSEATPTLNEEHPTPNGDSTPF